MLLEPTYCQAPPCFGQTEAEVKAWLTENVRIGATVVVRHTQAGLLRYAKVTVIRLGRGRFEVNTLGRGSLSAAGTLFYYTGRNCWQPKGQTRLVIPTDSALAACGVPGDLGKTYAATAV